jgi:hypothetical protein
VGRLPAGSAVSWKKRSPENVLPRRRSRIPNGREERAEAEQGMELPALAPACASPEVIAPRASTTERGATSGIVPRRESAGPVLQPLPRNERKDVRRPNPTLVVDEVSSREARVERRRARHAEQRKEKVLYWAGGALIVLLLLAVIVFALRFK